MELLKRVGRYLARIVSTALILCVAIVFLPHISKLISGLVPKGDPQITSMVLKQEMQKVGKLVTVEYTDTGVISSSVCALILGDVQKVTAPYTYQLGLGIDLSDVKVSVTQNTIALTVPKLSLIYDKLTVTENPTIEDFWYPLTQTQYQNILDTQAKKSREAYLNDASAMDKAWDATVEKLESLTVRWLDGAPYQVSILKDENN